jgi:hypothetical protein
MGRKRPGGKAWVDGVIDGDNGGDLHAGGGDEVDGRSRGRLV